MFQLSQLAFYHLQNKYNGGPKVIGIEVKRPAYQVANGERSGKPYNRLIDIVLDEDGEETWVETKSTAAQFQKAWFTQTLRAKKSSGDGAPQISDPRGYYRQFFHDMRLNKNFINERNSRFILIGGEPNTDYQWLFHQFTIGAISTKPPIAQDLALAQRELCKLANVGNKKEF